MDRIKYRYVFCFNCKVLYRHELTTRPWGAHFCKKCTEYLVYVDVTNEDSHTLFNKYSCDAEYADYSTIRKIDFKTLSAGDVLNLHKAFFFDGVPV